ncbi:MAG: hypothetical protein V1867_06840 [Candidatus Falkowbacteria bacterium]
MRLFLPDEIWKNKRGFPFKKPVTYLRVGYHTGQDFLTNSVGKVPVFAPCDGNLTTYQFSRSAGWWGTFSFEHAGQVYSLKILHMFKEMKVGKYSEGDILGYCGATGFSTSQKYGDIYTGQSEEEQNSDKAVPHLHVELHKGEFKHDTNNVKALADLRIIDPIINFENWVNSKPTNNTMIFYKEPGKSSVYIKGADDVYYPIISGKHFITLFGDWKDNTIKEIENINPKSDSYFGLFKANNEGDYDVV